MCGRVVAAATPEQISRLIGVDEIRERVDRPDHNLAPTGMLPVVWDRFDGDASATPHGVRTRCLGAARWGLVPSWAKDPSIGARMFNARAETVAEKPSFRRALRRSRCLIPVDGFYEWGPGDGRKQPWFVHRSDGDLMVMAGLRETWSGAGDTPSATLETCTVITVPANPDPEPVHHRMPAVLPAAAWDAWLDTAVADKGQLLQLLKPADRGVVALRPVDHRVNDARNKGPGLLEATPAGGAGDHQPAGGSQEALW